MRRFVFHLVWWMLLVASGPFCEARFAAQVLPGSSAPVLGGGASVSESVVWRSRRLDATGFYWMGARYYEPQGGRFLSADPLGHAASLSLYDYANGDPVNGLDPDGRFGKSAFSESLNTQASSMIYGGQQSYQPMTWSSVAVQTRTIDPYAKPFSWDNAVTQAASMVPFAKNTFEIVTGKSFTTPGMPASRGEAFLGLQHEVAFTVATLPMGGVSSAGARVAAGSAVRTAEYSAMRSVAAKGAPGVKYIGKLDDLQGIPRSQTLLDDLPNLGSARANYYQNSSVLRGALRDGYEIRDASAFRLNSSPDPTRLRPDRTVGQSFLGAERNILDNKGLILGPNGAYIPR